MSLTEDMKDSKEKVSESPEWKGPAFCLTASLLEGLTKLAEEAVVKASGANSLDAKQPIISQDLFCDERHFAGRFSLLQINPGAKSRA